jgi:hypothetical protein
LPNVAQICRLGAIEGGGPEIVHTGLTELGLIDEYRIYLQTHEVRLSVAHHNRAAAAAASDQRRSAWLAIADQRRRTSRA